jgi:DNA-binding NtrC family response regulator
MARKPSLLIVDDETSVLLTLQMVFQEAGYVVAAAASEARALQLLRKPGKLDAVLTDISMENDQSGVEVAKAAAQLRPRPVIVVFTGFSTIDNMKAAVGTAVDHFALKPIDLDEVKRVLTRLLALRGDRLAASSSGQVKEKG